MGSALGSLRTVRHGHVLGGAGRLVLAPGPRARPGGAGGRPDGLAGLDATWCWVATRGHPAPPRAWSLLVEEPRNRLRDVVALASGAALAVRVAGHYDDKKDDDVRAHDFLADRVRDWGFWAWPPEPGSR